MIKVLVVDDEANIRSIVTEAVRSNGARAFEAATGFEAVSIARNERPSLVILDLGLPDMDGIDVCRALREWSSVPVMVLSAGHSDEEKATLLDAGADDYLTKPFSSVELKARIRALLRRASMEPIPAGDAPLVVANLTIDIAKRAVRRDEMVIHLTPTEWDLLRALVARAGRTLTHRQLFDAVWGRHHGDAQQYLRVYVANLRRKLEQDPLRPSLILTEPGVGYRFELAQ